MADLTIYLYERGDGRFKHRWKHDRAGFVPGRRGQIGKCHRSISEAVALALLHDGITEPSPYDDDEAAPTTIYAVYRGVPYVAVPTRPGVSYHGYPWRGRMAASVRLQLHQRAVASGDEKVFEQWLREYEQ